MTKPFGTRAIKARRGGSRPGAGAPGGNRNGQKAIPLPENFDLETSEGILRFIKSVLIPSALTSSLGVRSVTAITSCCKLLLDYESLTALEARVKAIEEPKGVKPN